MPRIARTMAAALGLVGGVVASQGPEFAQQYRQRLGGAIGANIERLERLERQRQAFVDAGPFQRLVVLTRDADIDLMRAAYQDFEPAVPATEESVVAGRDRGVG